MKAYLIGLFATVCIAVLNLIGGNAATGFSAIHSWVLVFIAFIACAVGAYEGYFREKVLAAIKEAGLLDELEDGTMQMADKLIEKMEKTDEEDKNDVEN